ncbi:serine/threonine protein phosphatase [Chromatium okenii]|uniref:SpoIIE family protein phosphatase n=1 Tax=Chromatium okenii TaxID=61644 RepID=UPI0019057D47|nr:SpoIIE family protein phosphatase [Chromatium okenii]MBK1640784.1 serine/threonine protein phosphatase [Chromatium okenii]
MTSFTSQSQPNAHGWALIVDDSASDRQLLTGLLTQIGFKVCEAANGAAALASFVAHQPDMVFMDILMDGIDGCETTRQLKRLAGATFVPVIIVTASTDKQAALLSTQAGADDFLTKPFSPQILQARIMALERVRDLQRIITTRRETLATLVERGREEQALAERVLSRAVTNRNVAMDRLIVAQRPASVFNGDLVLTQYLPDGGLRLLVGDFTGHGLAAAIGALPVADVFHATARKGVDDARVVAEINHKLHQILPADRFLAACLVSISGNGEELRWWNGGMPSMWLRRRDGLHELASHALPLGILPELTSREVPHHLSIASGDRLLMMSDGLPEALDPQGRMFAATGCREVLPQWKFGQPLVPKLLAALDAHCAGIEPLDDIAVVEIPLDVNVLAMPPLPPAAQVAQRWQWALTVQDGRLGQLPSLTQALRPLGLLEQLDIHIGVLETICTELYSNALEHGILGLDSTMKATQEGFEAYYRQREQQLLAGCKGWIRVQLHYETDGVGHCVRLGIAHSGRGFCDAAVLALPDDPQRPWGRGIAMVRELCANLTYQDQGTRVEAVYQW